MPLILLAILSACPFGKHFIFGGGNFDTCNAFQVQSKIFLSYGQINWRNPRNRRTVLARCTIITAVCFEMIVKEAWMRRLPRIVFKTALAGNNRILFYRTTFLLRQLGTG